MTTPRGRRCGGRSGIDAAHLLVNVKRLHPLAGQRYLLEAMPEIVREHPDTHLVICGTGALLPELQAVARSAGVERHVTFAGLVDNARVARYCAAADLFVLPSLLEALPTVAVEALASGTPVISSDNPGGVELHGVFGDDVAVVPKEQPAALAGAIAAALRQKRRTHRRTQATSNGGSAPTPWRGGIFDDLRGSDGRMTYAPSGAPRRPHCSPRCSGAAWLALLYAWHPRLSVEFDRDLPRLLSGVHPPERDETSGLTFAWTGADVGAAAARSRPPARPGRSISASAADGRRRRQSRRSPCSPTA